MNLGLFGRVFLSVFLAELGDKTQLATMVFAADGRSSRATVFLASAAALVLTSALGVFAGGFIGERLDARRLTQIAGGLFIVLGVWTLWRA